MTISSTVTNDGGRKGELQLRTELCALHRVARRAILCAPNRMASPLVGCAQIRGAQDGRVPPGRSVKVPVPIATEVPTSGGSFIGNYVPVPPGHDTLVIKNLQGQGEGRLPVTITPPATLPLTIDHPSEVTTGSGQQHDVTSRSPTISRSRSTTSTRDPASHGVDVSRRLRPGIPGLATRLAPPAVYDTRANRSGAPRYALGANGTNVTSALSMASPISTTAVPAARLCLPGVYHFVWDGERSNSTITQ